MGPGSEDAGAGAKMRYDKNPEIVYRKIAGETILVPIRKKVGDMDRIYTLNETGAFIWEKIGPDRAVGKLAQDVCAEFAVDEATARREVLEFIESLLKAKAICPL